MLRNTTVFMFILLSLALFSVPGLAAFAANANQAVATFPDTGALPDHWQYEVLGFQKALLFFKMAAGKLNSETLSLYYLALTMGMVGLLLIILHKKFQEPATIGAWFVITFIMLVGPYNSKLFFYPLESEEGDTITQAFTPQLVALHFTNVLHKAIHDVLFECTRGNGIGDNGIANTGIAAAVNCGVRNPVVEATDASGLSNLPASNRKIENQGVRSMAHFYVGLGCGEIEDIARGSYHMYNNHQVGDLVDVFYGPGGGGHCSERGIAANANLLIKRTAAQSEDSSEEECLPSPEEHVRHSSKFLFSDYIDLMTAFYANGYHTKRMTPPYASVYKADTSSGDSCAATAQVQLDAAETTKYEFGEEEQNQWRDGHENLCTLDEADRIAEVRRGRNNSFSSVSYAGGTAAGTAPKWPAFFLAQAHKAPDGEEENTYAFRTRKNSSTATALAPSVNNDGVVTYEERVKRIFMWGGDGEAGANLPAMPVKLAFVNSRPRAANFNGSLVIGPRIQFSRERSMFGHTDRSVFGPIGDTEKNQPVATCVELHARMHERALLEVFDKLDVPKADAIEMLTGSSVPEWFYEKRTGSSAQYYIGQHVRNTIRAYQNRALRYEESGNPDSDLPDSMLITPPAGQLGSERASVAGIRDYLNHSNQAGFRNFLRLQLNTNLINNALRNSEKLTTVAATVSPDRDSYIYSTQNTFEQGFASGPIGWFAGGLARIGVLVTSWFAGAIVPIYLKFLMLIIKIAVMGLLMLTPLLLLMGMVVPGNAPGVLILTIGGVFIMKFVPITFTIIDAIIGQVMELVDGTASAGNAAWTGGGLAAAAVVGAGASIFLTPFVGIPLAVGISSITGNMGGDQGLERALVIHAAAMAYTASTGITLFLLFKVGDPSVLQNLTQLDDISKDIGQKGIDGLKQAAAFAAKSAVPVGGAALGGHEKNGTMGALTKGGQALLGAAGKELGFDGGNVMDGLKEAKAQAMADEINKDNMEGAGINGKGNRGLLRSNPILDRVAEDFNVGSKESLKQKLMENDAKYAAMGEAGWDMRKANFRQLALLNEALETRDHQSKIGSSKGNGMTSRGVRDGKSVDGDVDRDEEPYHLTSDNNINNREAPRRTAIKKNDELKDYRAALEDANTDGKEKLMALALDDQYRPEIEANRADIEADFKAKNPDATAAQIEDAVNTEIDAQVDAKVQTALKEIDYVASDKENGGKNSIIGNADAEDVQKAKLAAAGTAIAMHDVDGAYDSINIGAIASSNPQQAASLLKELANDCRGRDGEDSQSAAMFEEMAELIEIDRKIKINEKLVEEGKKPTEKLSAEQEKIVDDAGGVQLMRKKANKLKSEMEDMTVTTTEGEDTGFQNFRKSAAGSGGKTLRIRDAKGNKRIVYYRGHEQYMKAGADEATAGAVADTEAITGKSKYRDTHGGGGGGGTTNITNNNTTQNNTTNNTTKKTPLMDSPSFNASDMESVGDAIANKIRDAGRDVGKEIGDSIENSIVKGFQKAKKPNDDNSN